MSKYLDKIKKISGIKISKICNQLNIDRSNLLNGRTTEENEKRVYEKIMYEYEKIKKR